MSSIKFYKKVMRYFHKWAGGIDNPNCVRIEDAIPPIIDKEIWERTRKRMENNIKGNNKTRREYLLSGLMRCEKCGAPLHGITKISGKGYETPYYVCTSKYNKRTCDLKNINANDLDTLVLSILKKELLNPKMITNTVDTVIKLASVGKESKEEKENSIRKQIVDVTTKSNNLLNALMTGLDSDMVREKLMDLEIEKKALEESLNTLEYSKTKKIKRDELTRQLNKDAELLLSSENVKELIHKYISKIIIADDTVTITVFGDYVSNEGCSLEESEKPCKHHVYKAFSYFIFSIYSVGV